MYEYDLSANRNVTNDGEGALVSVGSFDGNLASQWEPSQERCDLGSPAPHPSVDEEICTELVRHHTQRALPGSAPVDEAIGNNSRDPRYGDRNPLDQTSQPQQANSAGARGAHTTPTPAPPRGQARAQSRARSNPQASAPPPSQLGFKLTLAAAFSASTEGWFLMIQSHLQIEQRGMEQEGAWAEKQEEQAYCKDKQENTLFAEQLSW